MSSVGDLQHALVGENRTAVATFLSQEGQTGQAIQTRNTLGQFLEFGKMRQERLTDLVEQSLFERYRPLAGAKRFILEFLELFGDVPFRVLDRLLAGPGDRDFFAMRVCDFDVVPEDLVEADLERSDMGFFREARLMSGEPLLAVAPDFPEPVQFRIKAGRDDIAVAQVWRAVALDGADQIGALLERKLPKREQFGGDIFGALEFLKLVKERWD